MITDDFKDMFDYSKLSVLELIEKIGYSRYWDLPTMLKEVLKKIVASISNTLSIEDNITDGVIDKAPSQNAVFDALLNKTDKNIAISAATKTKITYDSKGLVTTGTDATTADINPSTNRNYITDLNLTDVNNLSGINKGDQTSIVGISGTKAQYNSSLTDGDFLFVGDLNVGLVTMTDFDGTSFTDLISARAKLRTGYLGVIFDESFSVNTYRFSVPKNSQITQEDFLFNKKIGFEDPKGLFTFFNNYAFSSNKAKIVLGDNIVIEGSGVLDSIISSITIGYNVVFNGTQAFANSSNSGHSITIGSISQLSTDAGLFSGFNGKLTILDNLGNNPTIPYTNGFVNLTNLLLFVNVRHKTNNNGGVHAWLQQMILAGAKVFYDGEIDYLKNINELPQLQGNVDVVSDKIPIWDASTNTHVYVKPSEIGSVPTLLPFSNTKTYKTDEFVSYEINNQNYIFKSKINNHNSIPTLIKAIKPWINFQYGGIFKGTWNNTTFYVTNDVLLRDGYLYFCLTNNSNSDPIFLPPPNWLKIGVYKGVHSLSYAGGYEIGDVVIDSSNNVYISNLRFNSFTISQVLNHGWDIIADKKTTIAFWGDSLTFGTGSYGNSDYPSVLSQLTGLNVWNGGVPGETSTQIKIRFLSDKSKWDLPTVFWVGRNNNSNTAIVKADIAEMVSKLGHNRYLVIGIIKSTGDVSQPIDGLNLDLKNLYGERFIDAQSYLLQYFDTTIPQDVADNTAGRIAWSLRTDWLHLNNKSYKLIAEIVASKINFLVNNSNETNSTLLSSGIRVEDNLVPLERKKAVEIGFRKDLDFGFIQVYDRINNLPKKFSIQSTEGSELALIENGGSLNIGDKTFIKGSDNVLTLKGKSVGNSVYLDFKNSDNLTRGNVGYPSVGNNNFFVNNDVGDVYIIGQKTFAFSTNTGTPNEIVRNIDIVLGLNNPTTTVLTSTQLNTQYPTAKTNFKVYCTSIVAGAMVYEKTPTQWIGTAVFVP